MKLMVVYSKEVSNLKHNTQHKFCYIISERWTTFAGGVNKSTAGYPGIAHLVSSVQRQTSQTPAKATRPRGRPKGSKNKKQKHDSTCRAEASSSGHSSKNSDLECAICKEGRDAGRFTVTECGHLFHYDCLEKWLITSRQK
ncbi:E3 ubiquitin-protein ligase TTC3-like [Frankliniella occidentalis]|uniref:E3 ubiquitin-protein ligase TTC3-like n=1 Tax=Frankliniella occidentalis TaxID=133901 RepID=A0A9C6U1F8_FRAOC|nr:E3 ubiquitin-protein ligase TTC3-like [Frankliniella occidentalis]